MHELAAMQEVVRLALDCMQQASASRVTNIQLVLGASGHLTADAAYQHFEALTRGTPAQDASLTIQWLPAKYQCFSCLQRFESSELSSLIACPECGDIALEVSHQEVCSVTSIDVSFEPEEEEPTPSLIPQEKPEAGIHILSAACNAPVARGVILW